jgi:hypothetical protein
LKTPDKSVVFQKLNLLMGRATELTWRRQHVGAAHGAGKAVAKRVRPDPCAGERESDMADKTVQAPQAAVAGVDMPIANTGSGPLLVTTEDGFGVDISSDPNAIAL